MEIADFKAKLPAKKALIGFDYGSRRLGGGGAGPTRTAGPSLNPVVPPELDKRRGGPAPDY